MGATDQQWDIVSSVGLTALAVAAGRAVETARPDALIQDAWAARFVDRADPPAPMPTSPTDPLATTLGWRYLTDLMAVRSRFFDDYLGAVSATGIRQIVVLAAGLDVRAYRLKWPRECQWFELDQPEVLQFKDSVLAENGAQPGCQRHAVAADLRQDWPTALEAAGFDPTRPTAWLAEGLLQYLSAATEDRLLTHIDRLSAPGSHLAATHSDGPPSLDWAAQELGLDFTQLIHSEPRPPLAQRLRSHGWHMRASESLPEAGQRLGRPLTNPAPTAAERSMLSWACRD
jgi:methyltransferase (TIGR00027 family)